MTTPLTVQTSRRDDGSLVVTAAGEIDQSNVGEFSQALASAAAHPEIVGGGKFCVDLSAVEYLDSAAINALYIHADRMRLIVHALLMNALKVSGLSELTTVEPASPAH